MKEVKALSKRKRTRRPIDYTPEEVKREGEKKKSCFKFETDLNYERRNIQEAVSFYPIQELSPRPVWPAGDVKEVVGSAIHESFRKHRTFSIAINFKLLLVLGARPQSPSQWIVIH